MRKIAALKLLGWVMLAAFVALASPQAEAASGPEFCWKDSYTRGVGKVPGKCASGYDRIGLLCYRKCPSNMKRSGLDCHSKCPSGMSESALHCRKAEYGRGAGYPWKFGDAMNDSGMKSRCERRHGRGKCEKQGLVFYAKCRPGFTNIGLICRPSSRPNCRALGLGRQIDLSCEKRVAIGKPRTGECGAGQDKDGGLCYKKCRAGHDGVGPVCWTKKPGRWVDCGMGVAKDKATCASITFSQVASVGQIAMFVASFGGSGAAQKATTGPQEAKKLSELQKKYAAMVAAFQKFRATPRGRAAIDSAKVAGRIGSAAAGGYRAGTTLRNATTEEDMVRVAAQIAAIVDPSGVASAVGAYSYPKCSKYFGAASASRSRPAAPAPTGPWIEVSGAATDIAVGGTSGGGHVWKLGTKRESGGFAVYRRAGNSWRKIPGSALRIAVDPAGNAWTVNKQGQIHHYNGRQRRLMPGTAFDISVGAGGHVWIIGRNKGVDGYGIFRWVNNTWRTVPGRGMRIAVDPAGNAWVIDGKSQIHRYDGRKWHLTRGLAHDIAIGAGGHIWIIGKTGETGGYGIYRRNGGSWTKVPGAAMHIAVNPSGRSWAVNSQQKIYYKR